MSRNLGDAWIAVQASGKDFGTQVSRIVKAGTAGLKADIPVTVNDLSARLSFANLKKARDDLAAKITDMKVGADDKTAQAALLRLKARADSIKLSPTIDLQGMARAQAQLLTLEASADKLNSKLKDAGGGGGRSSISTPGLLATAGLASAPLLPLVAGFGGALLGAGAGIGAFALAAAPAFSKISTALQQVQSDTLAYDRATTAAAKNTALQHIKDDWASLSPPQRAAVSGLQSLDRAWNNFTSALAPSVFQVAAIGIGAAGTALGTIKKIALDAAPGMATLATNVGKLVNSGLKTIEPAVKPGMDILNQFISQMSGPLIHLISIFTSTLTNNKSAVSGFVSGLTGFVGLTVDIFGGLVNILAKLPPPVLAALSGGILAIVTAVKLWNVAQKILTAELLANPIGLTVVAIAALATAFYLAWTKSAGFRDFIKTIGADVLGAGVVVVQGVKLITDAFLSMVGAILHGLVDAFGWVPDIGPKLKTASKAFDGFKGSVDSTFNGIIKTMQGWQGELTVNAAVQKATTAKITADFASQAKSASNAGIDLSKYSDAIAKNGVSSDIAKAARAQLIKDLEGAGVKSTIASTDVSNYTNAVKDNGLKSDAAKKARQQLITDILNASSNAKTGKTDLANLTTQIELHGQKSDAAKKARQQLITDLENAGVSASTATSLVQGLTQSIGKIPASANVVIHMRGDGSYTITGAGPRAIKNGPPQLAPLATGGRIIGGIPGRDSVLGMLMPGEVVVPTHMVNAGAVDHLRGRLPGFAGGGLVTNMVGAGNPNILPVEMANRFNIDITRSLTQAMADAINQAVNAARAAAQAATAGTGGTFGDSGARSGSAALAQAFASSVLSQFGWSQSQMGSLIPLWNQESGWNAYAVNASSGAYGIPQSLGHGHPYNLGDYKSQVLWGLTYIRGRYGSPAAAEQHERAFNWYGGGGLVADSGKVTLRPGFNSVFNGTGAPEPMQATHIGGLSPDARAMLDELRALRRAVTQQAALVGQVISGTAGRAASIGYYGGG